MKNWNAYLNDNDPPATKKRKNKGPGCKRNKIGKNRLGYCSFSEKNECIFCKRPRRKNVTLNPVTKKIVVEYLE